MFVAPQSFAWLRTGVVKPFRCPFEIDVTGPPTDPETFARTFLAKVDRFVARKRKSELQQYLTTHPVLCELHDSPVDQLLGHAIEQGNSRLAEMCLEIGAKPDGCGDAFPPMFYALERADDDLLMLRLLLEHDADPNVRLINDYTPLHNVAQQNKLLAAEQLISAGAEIDAETRIDDYFTPAMEASSRGHVEMLRLFLNAGANPRHRNCCGKTIVDVAGKRSRDHIEKIVTESKPKRRTT